MKQYLLNIYQPSGGTPAPEFLEKVMRDVDALIRGSQDGWRVGVQWRPAPAGGGHGRAAPAGRQCR